MEINHERREIAAMSEYQEPETRTIINVEDYPGIDPDTKDGKDALGAIAFEIAQGRTPIHFVFRFHGKEIGEMIISSILEDKLH